MPFISVVVPAYNQAQFLPDALESILAQTYLDYEIIVVNDGSTDETAQVIDQYKSQVRVIWQENQGLAGARNTGIEAASGEIIAFLDSDDIWLPTYLDCIVSLSHMHPNASIFHTGWRYIDNAGEILPQAPNQTVIPTELAYQTMLQGNFLTGSTYSVRRSALLEVGLLDMAFRRLQDWELWLRMLSEGHELVGSDTCLVHYRLHERSLSTDPAGGRKAAQAIAEKQFGEEGDPWTAEKQRMYGGVYRYSALTSALARAHDWDVCGEFLQRAFQIDPSLMEDKGLFYELALGTQPVGYRGTSEQLDLLANEKAIRQMVEQFRVEFPAGWQEQFLSQVYSALGAVAYHTQQMALFRRFSAQAQRLGYQFDQPLMLLWLKSWLKPIATSLRTT